MVRFEDTRLIIEIETHSHPAEYWMELQKGLLDLLYYVTAETHCDDTFYTVPGFLRELIPDFDDAKKMER